MIDFFMYSKYYAVGFLIFIGLFLLRAIVITNIFGIVVDTLLLFYWIYEYDKRSKREKSNEPRD